MPTPLRLLALSLGALALNPTGSAQRSTPLSTAKKTNEPAIVVPRDPGSSFGVDLRLDGRADRLLLTRHTLRSATAKVRVFVRDERGERYVDIAPPAARTYRGTLASDPATVVLASFTDHGFEADIETPTGPGWSVRMAGDGEYRVTRRTHEHDEYGDHLDVAASCGVSDEGVASARPSISGRQLAGGTRPCQLQLAEIAFDADFEYYQLHGSSIANVIAQIDAHMNLVDYFYARDVLITYAITGYVIRTSSFYSPTSGGDLLNLFRAEWNANQGAIQRDIGHLMTAKPGAIIQYGGLAWVGVVCTNSAYGWSLDSANIIGHEVGHNWAAPHCLDPTPCNNMCGACLNVAPITKGVIEAHRDSRACLEPVGPYGTPVPPYAHPESRTFSKSRFASLGPLTFDVLRNDHDANCGPLILSDFEVISEQGGTIRRSSPQSNDLVYTAPATPWVGPDRFGYTVLDTSDGTMSTGTVTVDLRSPGVEAYWSFDDQTGTTISDLSGNGFDAVAQQPVEWVFPGIASGAMKFNGVDQLLDTNTSDFTPPWSVSAWIKRKTSSTPSSALSESSDGSLRTEQWANTQRLGVTKYGTGDFTSSVTLTKNVWTHVVWVGTASTTSMWVNGVLRNVHPVSIRAPMSPASRAGDPLAAVVDELRVYNHALTPAEIDSIYLLGGAALAPNPRDGGKLGVDSTPLMWVPGLMADSHDVYFGEDYAAVRDASTGSPEYLGNVVGASMPHPIVQLDRTYYWRVDTHVGAATLRGHLWQLERAKSWHWTLDETSGTIAAESAGGPNGTYLNGTALNRAGATPNTGTSIRLDGANDTVRIPALNLNSNTVTMTAWVRRNGAQSDFDGLVFSRAGSTVAGMNLSTSHQLGYHWNGDSATWSWNSGLTLPDDTWVFIALVITPAKATMFLGQAGMLTSASNITNHGTEEFNDVLHIGLDNQGTRYFRGWFDDVRVIDAALTDSEVNALYQASL